MYNVPASEIRLAKRLADQALATPPEPRLTNEQFAALSKPKQRVAIARDVLEWISTKRLVPRTGTYIALYDGPATGTTCPIPSTRVEDINGYNCQACALGGVFALVSFRTGCSIGDAARDQLPLNEAMHARLADYFSQEQLALIECAFEVSTGFDYGVINHAQALASWKFGDAIERACIITYNGPAGDRLRDERKMRAIMQNIIDNGGTFVP